MPEFEIAVDEGINTKQTFEGATSEIWVKAKRDRKENGNHAKIKERIGGSERPFEIWN